MGMKSKNRELNARIHELCVQKCLQVFVPNNATIQISNANSSNFQMRFSIFKEKWPD